MSNDQNIASSSEKPPQKMRDGTLTKMFFVKHLSLEDWALVHEIQAKTQLKTNADVLRHMIRKTANRT